jgi:hypothetical protein
MRFLYVELKLITELRIARFGYRDISKYDGKYPSIQRTLNGVIAP